MGQRQPEAISYKKVGRSVPLIIFNKMLSLTFPLIFPQIAYEIKL
jgi:hypothetical protein